MKDRWGERLLLTLVGSGAVHVVLLNMLQPAWPEHAHALEAAEELWIEPDSPSPPPPPPPPPEPTKVEPARTPHAPRPRSKPLQLPKASGTEFSSSPPTAAAEAETGGSEPALQNGAATSAEPVQRAAEPPRPALPAQLSLWLDPMALQGMVIVRSPSALLAALPGYRDMLRGSDINPFNSMRALRVYLPSLRADQLALAGVHAEGERAIVRAAEMMAASRERAATWRGSSELRASAWLDGSGYDRGLAVHGAAFLIGARAALPRLLGERAPAAQLEHLSKLRRGVVVMATLYDVASYLPLLRPCQLRSLGFSINDALKLQLDAEYETSDAAGQAATCLASLPGPAEQLRWMRELLSRANAAVGSTHSRLKTGVTYEDIARLLDELCWSLRHLVHA